MPTVPGVYLVGMPLRGRNTTTFVESDKFAAHIVNFIIRIKVPSTQPISNYSRKIRFWGELDPEIFMPESASKIHEFEEGSSQK